MSNGHHAHAVSSTLTTHKSTRFAPWSLLLMAALLPACSKAEEISEIQKAADRRVAQAQQEAQAKIAELQKQIDAVKAEAADAAVQVKAEADAAINKAQVNADEAAKALQAALTRAREAYKEDGRTHLNDLNKDFVNLVTQAKKTPAKDKAGYDKAIKDIVAHQKEVNADIAAFDKAVLDTFKAAKAKLMKDLATMKAAIKTGLAKLPKH